MANLEPFRSPEARVRFVAKYDAVLSGWPVPCVERDVTTAFGTTHIVANGSESAPPLVLLHGAAAITTMWRPIIAPLSGSYRYCVDTITDANKSVATRRVRGVADDIVWLREVFSALGITNARVAGLSYGGWLASQLAGHAPELVNRLLLLCPAATFAPLTIQFYVRIFSSNILRSQSLARRSGQWMSSTPDAPSDPTTSCAKSLHLRRFSLVTARSSTVAAPKPPLRAQRLIPNVRVRLVPGANHMLTLDAPEPVATEMTAALA